MHDQQQKPDTWCTPQENPSKEQKDEAPYPRLGVNVNALSEALNPTFRAGAMAGR